MHLQISHTLSFLTQILEKKVFWKQTKRYHKWSLKESCFILVALLDIWILQYFESLLIVSAVSDRTDIKDLSLNLLWYSSTSFLFFSFLSDFQQNSHKTTGNLKFVGWVACSLAARHLFGRKGTQVAFRTINFIRVIYSRVLCLVKFKAAQRSLGDLKPIKQSLNEEDLEYKLALKNRYGS